LFYWSIDIEKFFSLTYRLAELFELPSYKDKPGRRSAAE